MTQVLAENWLLAVVALVIALVVAWWVFMATRRTRVETDRRDTLDEGAAPAARNQALIDAAPAAHKDPVPIPPAAPEGLAGVGAAIAAAVEDAQLEADEAAHAHEPAAEATAAVAADDLTMIKGLGPKLATLLGELGVTRFAQIAAWDDAEIDRIDAQLGRFEGRIRRDGWVEQAQMLADGDIEAFRARFGAT
ncbi:hypothetical protein [Tsuneonella mangrovi]|uniref:hypothetical protein n=1 Tax=Tsuneonella mangrovi TaxID=1982042 RepID=UPI000BA1C5B4|nr:hypothetical protein [Tsuneonella mangrovi]